MANGSAHAQLQLLDAPGIEAAPASSAEAEIGAAAAAAAIAIAWGIDDCATAGVMTASTRDWCGHMLGHLAELRIWPISARCRTLAPLLLSKAVAPCWRTLPGSFWCASVRSRSTGWSIELLHHAIAVAEKVVRDEFGSAAELRRQRSVKSSNTAVICLSQAQDYCIMCIGGLVRKDTFHGYPGGVLATDGSQCARAGGSSQDFVRAPSYDFGHARRSARHRGVFIPALDYSGLLPSVCAALCAKERFRQDAPAWAPELPLRREDCEALENDDGDGLNLVGLFGGSLREASWDYDGHPNLGVFARGLMAYEHTPNEIRNDRSLLKELPPRELAGLCDGELHWRSPAAIAWDRQYQARCAAHEAALAARAHGRIVNAGARGFLAFPFLKQPYTFLEQPIGGHHERHA